MCHSALIKAFRKNISAVDIHFDGLGILTNEFFCFAAEKSQEFVMKLNKRNNLKDECKRTGKSPKKPRRSAKRFGEISEKDVLKLKFPEHIDYNVDILFVSILMYLYMAVWSCR